MNENMLLYFHHLFSVAAWNSIFTKATLGLLRILTVAWILASLFMARSFKGINASSHQKKHPERRTRNEMLGS